MSSKITNTLLVQLLTQPHLQTTETTRPGSTSNKFVLNVASCTMMSKVQLEQAIDMNTHALQKDLHDQRIKQLRKLLKDIEEDDWQYEPVEKLIGLSFKSADNSSTQITQGRVFERPESAMRQNDHLFSFPD